MAFKKSKQQSQPDLFATASFSLPERERRYMEDELSWHNEFYRNVLLNIDEEILRPLFVDGNMGAPTKQLRILIAMRMLKEGRGCSDEQLYENICFNLVWRQAVGLFNINDECPSIDSYYMLFRRIAEYEQNNPEHVNLYKKIYQDLTAKQIKKYKIAGRTIRMDSKLIGSNIAWFSRYEIIHETFRMQVTDEEAQRISDQLYRQKALDFLAEDASKTVYRSDDEALGQRLLDLGIVISHILAMRGEDEVSLLNRVFHEQYDVDTEGNISVRDKKLISASSVQNPHDPVVTPAEVVLGEWYGQVMAGGMISNDKFYDNIAILMTFQADGHGMVQQYFLNSDKLIYQIGNMIDYIVDADGNVSIFVAGTNKWLGADARIVDGKVIASIPDYFVYDLIFDRPTEAQQQNIMEWGLIIDQWADSEGDNEGNIETEVTTNGAEEPGRARQYSK